MEQEMDSTEQARREMQPEMPALLAMHVREGGTTWTTEELSVEFEVQGFMAPLVVVRRRSDGVLGTLQFTDSPRVYFGWVEDTP